MKSFRSCLLLVLFICYSDLLARPNEISKPLKLQYLDYENAIEFLKLGNSWREAQDYDNAKFYLDKGYNMIQKYNNDYWTAVAYEYYGYYYRDIGDKEQALDYLEKAYEIFRQIITLKTGSPTAVLTTINNLKRNIYHTPEGGDGQTPPDSTIAGYNDYDSRLTSLERKYFQLSNKVDDLDNKIDNVNNRIDNLGGQVNEIGNEIKKIEYNIEKIWNKINGSTPPPVVRGKAISMLGVGFGPTYGIGETRFPPISISMNYRVSDNYEVGLFLGYSSEMYQTIKFDYRIIGLRLLYRMWQGDNWDISASLLVGYNSLSANEPLTSLNVSQNSVLYGGIVDFRYLFTQNVGVYLETGYGLSYASGGVVFNF